MSYADIFQSFQNLKKICQERKDTRLACPRLAIDRDGINWKTVRSMLYYTLRNSEVEIKIVTQEQLSKEDQLRIIRKSHETPLGGHQGINRTYKRILQTRHWKGMRQMIEIYILSCETYQRQKIQNRSGKEPMVITTTSSRPFEEIFLDIVGPFPKSHKGYILYIHINSSR